MSSIKIITSPKIPPFKKGTAFVIGAREESKRLGLTTTAIDVSSLSNHDLSELGIRGKFESQATTAAPDGAVFAIIGVGTETLDADKFRELGGSIARGLRKFKDVVVDLELSEKQNVLAFVEGVHLGTYEFQGKKSPENRTVSNLKTVSIVSDVKISEAEKEEISIVAEAVNATRDLVNSPPNEMYPASMVSAVKSGTRGLNLKVQIWDEKALAKDGFGGILAVGMGSSRPPRLVKIEYKPRGAAKQLALVGKGITFDTGGLSLKPAESMVGMKYDMTGAATSFQAIVAIAKLNIPVHVTAWLCLAENMPSSTAQRPDDVIRIRNGKSVEVLNTDAEGRLVLADGLSAAAETKPDLIVDIATLTGAATIALGNRYAGLMGDDKAVMVVESAAKITGELVWHMPLPPELRPLLNSEVADIANVKIGNRAGGMLIGGHFLREFVPKGIEWAHLDIAGPADNSGTPYGYTPKGGTGVMVKTLVAAARALADNR